MQQQRRGVIRRGCSTSRASRSRWPTASRWAPSCRAPRFKLGAVRRRVDLPARQRAREGGEPRLRGVLPGGRETAEALHGRVRRARRCRRRSPEYCRRVVTATLERHQRGRRGRGETRDRVPALARLRCRGSRSRRGTHLRAVRQRRRALSRRLQDAAGLPVRLRRARGGPARAWRSTSTSPTAAASTTTSADRIPLLLTWAFNDPTLRKTNFVVVHGGYPYYRRDARPDQQAERLRGFFGAVVLRGRARAGGAVCGGWLTQWPEKVLFGTDATPNTDDDRLGGDGLAGVADGARSARDRARRHDPGRRDHARPRARSIARMVLRDNAKTTIWLLRACTAWHSSAPLALA